MRIVSISQPPFFVRMIDRLLLFAQLFIKLQPQPAQVFDNPACFTHALHMLYPTLAAQCRTGCHMAISSENFSNAPRKDIFDVGIVESKHQFCRERRIRSCINTGSCRSNSDRDKRSKACDRNRPLPAPRTAQPDAYCDFAKAPCACSSSSLPCVRNVSK